MAPSITEAVSQTTEHIQEKLAAINVKEVQNGHTNKEKEASAPAVQEPEVQKTEDLEVKPIEQVEIKPTEVPAVKPAEEVEVKQPAGLPHLETRHKEPLVLSGVLDSFQSFDVTPVIGREFIGVDLAAWLKAPNSDELIRDLAITISQRGVVFFRAQDNITNDLQKQLVQRLGELSGKPTTSGLHIHPVANAGRENGGSDNEISVISSEQAKKIYADRFVNLSSKKQSLKEQWHSDITFEPIPSDYALLRLTELPKTGGDTLWASGYEVYDRISAPYQRFLESLTATYAQPGFKAAADANNFKLFATARGAPENIGDVLEAIHPVVRTNPVTGWKSIFAVGHHVEKINGLSELESKALLERFVRLIVDNHDLQVRHRWQNVNDLAIWDNRSVYHAATPDYFGEGLGERTGQRAVSLGERPYYDPESSGRREALAKGRGEVKEEKAVEA